jgi:hypothetical protein
MTDRQLLQQALDALETISEFAGGEGDVCEIIAKRARLAIPALRERLAQPEEKYQYGTPLLDLFTQETRND